MSPTARLEAGKFLLAHLAATTFLAGTLGLPGVGALMGLYNQVAQRWTGRDDINFEGSYRHWLSGMFGPNVADVVAKGAPRAAGVDLSKLGDENLVPGTSLMLDQRKLEDAEKDWLKTLAGAPIGVMAGILAGGRDIMNGDVMQGMTKILPEGLKGFAEAAYYAKHGYTDKEGPLPIAGPSAGNIAVTALGFDPSRLAQYQEAKRIGTTLDTMRENRSQIISQHLVKAQRTGDSAATSSWMNAAQNFTVQHPGMSSPMTSMAGDVSKRMNQEMMARALGVPLGIGALDPARASTDFLSQ